MATTKHTTLKARDSVEDGRIAFTAAVFRERGEPFTIERLTIEEPRHDEVLVRMVASGICHTDIAVQDRPSTPTPSILGHEGSGVVERVGAAVRKVQPGDHVVMSILSCGQCRFCLRGEPTYCEQQWPLNFMCRRGDGSVSAHGEQGHVCNHFFGQSSFGSYSLANERNVVKVPKSVPLDLLGPLGCGIQTGAGAVMNSLKVKVGDSFACFGAGSVGLSAVMAAHVIGATTIIAVDVVDTRLRLAKELGATHTINPKKQDAVEAIRKITGGHGLDYALDTTGATAVFDQAVKSLGMKGTYGYVTAGGTPERVFDARAFMAQGKRMMAILEGDAVPDLFIPYLIELYQQGRFPFDRLVKFYPLKQINRAIADSHHGKTIKPVIRF